MTEVNSKKLIVNSVINNHFFIFKAFYKVNKITQPALQPFFDFSSFIFIQESLYAYGYFSELLQCIHPAEYIPYILPVSSNVLGAMRACIITSTCTVIG